MFSPNKIFVATFVTLLAVVSSTPHSLNVTEIEKNSAESNPDEYAVLTLLKVTESDVDGTTYTYKCTVGKYSSKRLACTSHDSTSWPSPHNVHMKLRCPKKGSGLALSYVEIIFSVTSPSVNCVVNEGGIGVGYIGLAVSAWNTLSLSHSASFYTY